MKIDEPIRYPTEAELCADFTKFALDAGWVAYAETAGYDIVLAARDGTQIGIQAKLRFNLKVIEQILESYQVEGPDFRAILVPEEPLGARLICKHLGVTLIGGSRWNRSHWTIDLKTGEHWNGGWYYWNPSKRLKLPEYVPDVPAGVSGPAQLTKWKIAALRVVAILELRGWVTRATFGELDLDHRRWTGPDGWLRPCPTVSGRWIAPPEGLDFSKQHPVVYPKVLEDMRKMIGTGTWDVTKQPRLGGMEP